MFNQWFKKEMPFRGLTGFGGGSTGLANAGGDAWEEAGITATGGTVHNGQKNDDGTPYTWHVFPGGPRGPATPMPYTFSVSGVDGPGKIEYIMVAGGGMGGISPNPDPGGNPYKGAGGGGAGGVICNFQSPPANPGSNHPFYPLSPGSMTVSTSPGSYAIEVGRAAAGNPSPERSGKDTTFNGLTAVGGGWGAHANGPAGPAGGGGSGGGGGAPPGQQTGAGPTAPTQGKSGGDGETGSAGGGGGAESGGGGASGAGGEGIEFPDDGYFKLSVGGIADNPAAPGIKYLAGGGGGGAQSGDSGNPPGKGGFGGGGDASNPGNNPGSGGNADNWSGGGGGGAGGGTSTMPGGQGGQGMLFIRYVKNA